MFAFADVDGNGQIDKKEFEKTWQYLRQSISDQVLVKLHLYVPLDCGLISTFSRIVPTFLPSPRSNPRMAVKTHALGALLC